MKGKLKRIISLIMIMALMGASNVWASERPSENTNANKGSEIVIEPRSLYLATAISEIANEGEGVLRIYADFTSYRSVPWASLTITLQRRKNESSGSWSKVDTYTYEFDEDDFNGDLTYAGVEFYVNKTPGYYYRVKCVHKVKTPSGSYESKTTQTSGVLLTSYPAYSVPGVEE